MKKFILQAATSENHFMEILNLLEIDAPKQIIVSTAYMSKAGLVTITDGLKDVAHITKIFVGIRNGVTTAQAIEKALTLGCTVYAVDTGSSKKIFHPKMYFSLGEKLAQIIIGSANLTLGGMRSNIEASICETLDLTNANDATLVDEINKCYKEMITQFPEHVIKITCHSEIKNLLIAGRLMDEGKPLHPLSYSHKDNRELDEIPEMKLQTASLPANLDAGLKALPIAAKKSNGKKQEESCKFGPVLVWESSPLTRRDLNIPDQSGTHPTGSMLWKKGKSDINQQTYFRNEVFDKLSWSSDPKDVKKEQAKAKFIIVIRGIEYGCYKLMVTNDTRTDTKSYKQHQPMSALRWGDSRPLISRNDLLGRTLWLYRLPSKKCDRFLIEID